MSSAFPKDGIHLSFLNEFILRCGGRDALIGLSTGEVVEKFIKPATAEMQASYCTLLTATGCTEHVGEAQVYICHAWAQGFLDTLDSLQHHLRDHKACLWIDIFSSNQHTPMTIDAEWFASTLTPFMTTMRTLVVLPWPSLLVLSRSWCLWEIFTASGFTQTMEIAMTAQHMDQLIGELSASVSDVMDRLIAAIDITSSCSEGAKEMICEAFAAAVPKDEANGCVAYGLQEALIKAITAIMQPLAQSDPLGQAKAMTCMLILADIYCYQEKYADAEKLYLTCWRIRETLFGKEALQALEVLDHLAQLYGRRGSYGQASKLMGHVVAQLRAVAGDDHPMTLATIAHLAAIEVHFGHFQEAARLLEEVLAKQRVVCGDGHLATLASMSTLAACYHHLDQMQLAELLYTECLHGQTALLGEDHQSTWLTMLSLSQVYQSYKQYDLAEPLLRKAHGKMRACLGAFHERTLACASNLAELLEKVGKLEEARELLQDLLDKRNHIYGMDHQITKVVIAKLEALQAQMAVEAEQDTEQSGDQCATEAVQSRLVTALSDNST